MRVATHSGSFHADEVFALAVLRAVHGAENVEIVRTRDRELHAAADLRVDVGHRYDPATGDFDHHQRGGAGERPNGIRYASFGLVWKAFGVQACGGDEVTARFVEEALVQGIDANDTGQTIATPVVEGVAIMGVSGVIGGFNPTWEEPEDDATVDARFHEALALAEGVLAREIRGAAATARAQEIVARCVAASADPRIVELDRSLPWMRAVHAHAPEALYVLAPKSAGWGVQAVQAVPGQFANRKDLPEAWAGLEHEALQEVTGVPDAVFCHAARFLAVARSREGAMALARAAVDA
ncbi:MYG1 family protein [Conexibacter sp. W3-3-2]|uniref:MYG1 family protein n=1 Tax=Conexibacter sp. W3-3-2 TaxID=2675227 RepID=UPI0012B77555|nr:MYG1 family protein [Conexibacter sp. W3-3-2]MTD45238.1 MYG1 family protein [Conexibacter sp. W3-3-2]